MRNIGKSTCLDTRGQQPPSLVGLELCHGQGNNQVQNYINNKLYNNLIDIILYLGCNNASSVSIYRWFKLEIEYLN